MKITRKEAHKEVKFPTLARYKGCGSICIIYNRGGGEYKSIALHDGSEEHWGLGQELNKEFEFLPVGSVVELKQQAK